MCSIALYLLNAYVDPMTTAHSIDITPAAAARVALIAQKQGKSPILRLSIEGGGCAGFQYQFGLADTILDEDVRAQRDGVRTQKCR